MSFRYALAFLAVGLASTAAAEDDIPGLSQVTVTATLSPQPVEDTPSSVTIVTRSDIERLQPHSVPELIAGLTGIAIASAGDLGKASYLLVRGTDPDQVLVLIDGVKIGSATTGAAALEQLPVGQIDRIEIVRGPLSSLYGSGAIGGVIQIFTRHAGPGTKGEPSLLLSGGSHGTYQAQAGYSGSAGNGWYDASVTGLTTNGIPVCARDAPASADCYTTHPRQGDWSDSALVSGGYRWGDLAQLSVDGLRAHTDTKFDGTIYSGNESRELQQVLGSRLALRPLAALHISFAVGQSEDQSVQYFGDSADGYFDTRRNTLSWLNALALAPGEKLTLGSDFEEDTIGSDTAYALTSRHDVGLFGLYQWTRGRGELELSAREDDNQQFGHHATGSAAWGFRVSEALRLWASYGTAFEAPTFNDLYFPDYGNPLLHPEISRSAEVGVSGATGLLGWTLDGYQTRIDEMIEYNPITFAAANIDEVRIRGLEGQLALHAERWRAKVYLTLLDPRDRAPGPTYDAFLPLRPREMARLELDYVVGRVDYGATLYAQDRTFNDPENTQPIGGFATLALRSSFALGAHWMLQGLVQNALDKSYETVLYYNQPGAELFLSLRYTPTVQ